MLDSGPDEQVTAGFAVIYTWRIDSSMETEFIEAWRVITTALKKRGSLGARLHRGHDGLWYSYAQWPSAERREAAFAQGDVDESAQRIISLAIRETFPEIVLSPEVDLLSMREPDTR